MKKLIYINLNVKKPVSEDASIQLNILTWSKEELK